MIERIYADNFRTFVNSEIQLKRTTLLLGPNGSGKTTVFEAILRIQRLISGDHNVQSCFPSDQLTRWDARPEQTFEVDLRNELGMFTYRLEMHHDRGQGRGWITQERLTLDGKLLFAFTQGTAQLFNDYGGTGPTFTLDRTKSGLSVVFARDDNNKLTRFKKDIQSILVVVKPLAPMISPESRGEDERLEPNAANFVSWYRYISRQDIGRQHELFERLREILPGFSSFSVRGLPDAPAVMMANFRAGHPQTRETSYRFDELSDGQRALLLLYTLLYGAPGETRSLFIDEPGNFLGLAEVQPWLTAALDAAGENLEQVVLISHNSEIINYMAESKGLWFARQAHGPTRVADRPTPALDDIAPAEAIARELVG